MKRALRILVIAVLVVTATGVAASPAAAATQRSIRCAQAAAGAGWPSSQLVTAVAVALAESWCTVNAVNHNGPTAGCASGSTDRGAWQINDCYHGWVSDSCAFNLTCNANSAYTIYTWSGWSAWATYTNGAYAGYRAEAQAGVNAARGEIYGTVTTGGGSLTVRSGASTSHSAVGSVAEGSSVRIYCQVRGQRVYSEVYQVWTDLWDRIGTGRYVSDAYVYTGSSGQVAPTC
jgi:hypothetical protein